MRTGSLLAAGCVVALAACSAPPRPVFPPALVPSAATTVSADDARTWIERGRAYEHATGNFSAVVGVAVRDLARGQSFEARGAIAVQRPDAMRMQISAAGGVTAVDLLARDGNWWLRLAGRDWVRGRLNDAPGAGFPAGALARSFLGFDWDHASAVTRSGALAVLSAPSTEGHALVTIEPADGTTREVRWFTGDSERARVRFAEFERGDDGIRWPRVVLFWQAQPGVSSTITVESRTVSPTLPPATFAAPN